MVKKYIYCYCKRDVRWDPIYLQNSYQLNNPPPLLLSQIFSTPKASSFAILFFRQKKEKKKKRKKKLCNFISSLIIFYFFMRVCNCRGYGKFLRELQFSISKLLSPNAMGQKQKVWDRPHETYLPSPPWSKRWNCGSSYWVKT